jgi:hypothetical protein
MTEIFRYPLNFKRVASSASCFFDENLKSAKLHGIFSRFMFASRLRCAETPPRSWRLVLFGFRSLRNLSEPTCFRFSKFCFHARREGNPAQHQKGVCPTCASIGLIASKKARPRLTPRPDLFSQLDGGLAHVEFPRCFCNVEMPRHRFKNS